MSKKRKLIIIATIIITLILALIGIAKADTYRNFYVSSLEKRETKTGDGESIFCLARGKALGGQFIQSCIINIGGFPDGVIKPKEDEKLPNEVKGTIKGTTAYKYTESDTNGRTTITDKGNAKLAYICYRARGENVYHTYSPAQNAMWKYFKTWMAYCGKELKVSDNFKYNSSPAVSSYADEVINEAEEYYKVLSGKSGIKIINNNAKVIEFEEEIKNTENTENIENTENTENEENTTIKRVTKYYIGPFRVNITSEKFINSVTEEPIVGIDTSGVIGYLGIAKEAKGEIYAKLDTDTAKKGFYIVLDATKEGVNQNQEFKLKYKVLKVKALIKLYYYDKGAASQQQIAAVHTSKGVQEVITEFSIIKKDKNVSIQKYIVETGEGRINQNSNNPEESNFTFSAKSKKIGEDRKNRYATMSSSGEEEGIYKDVKAIKDIKAITTSNINGKSSAYKSLAPVKIEQGDYVVYKITAYNNGPEAQQIEIRDRIEQPGKLIRNLYKI